MATVNLKRNSKFNQKRDVSVGVFDLSYSDITTDGSIVAKLAAGSVITKVTVIQTSAANAGAKFTLLAGTTSIVTNGALDSNNTATVVLANLDIAKSVLMLYNILRRTAGM